MSKTFGFKGVEEIMGRIQPGIEEAQITGVVDGTNDNGKYYLSLKFVTLDGAREHEERFYFTTDKGERISLQRLKSILREVAGKEKADGEYTVEQLNAMLTGKKARWKFTGEEYEYNGDIRLRTQLAFSDFIESLNVKSEDSKLKFDENKDIKRMPTVENSTYYAPKTSTATGNVQFEVEVPEQADDEPNEDLF